MQNRSRIVAREFKSGDRPDLYAGTLPLESSQSHHIHCCESQSRVVTDVDVSRASLPCQGSEVCAGEIARRRLLRKG